jgi:hypothetical protein
MMQATSMRQAPITTARRREAGRGGRPHITLVASRPALWMCEGGGISCVHYRPDHALRDWIECVLVDRRALA